MDNIGFEHKNKSGPDKRMFYVLYSLLLFKKYKLS